MQLFILIFFSSLICGLHETGDQAVLGGWPNRLMRSYLRVPCEGHVGLLKLLCHDVREANSVFPFSKFRINYTFTVCRASEATGGTGFTLSQMRRCALRNRLPFLHSFVMVLAAAWRTEAGAGSKLNCDAAHQVIQWSRWDGMVPGT